MSKFEVWKKQNLGQSRGLPERTHFVIDTAMFSVEELSIGSYDHTAYDYSKYPVTSIVVKIPNAYAIIERGNKQSECRGWGIGGKWYPAVNCKRCKNTGNDYKDWGLPCVACKGASFNPKV